MAAFAQSNSSRFAGLVGDEKFFDVSTVSDPGTLQTLINETVPTGKKWQLAHMVLNCIFDADITGLLDSTEIANGHTGPGEPNFFFAWFPVARPMLVGEVLRVNFLQITPSPITKISAHVFYTELDV